MDIYVGNLPYSAGNQDLEQLFAEHGNVASARVIMNRDTGESKGFGFVEMPDNDEALKAIEAINGQELQGRALRVNESRPRPARDDGPRDGGGYR